MLRNLNKSESGRRICGITRVGILANEIPTGFAIPSLLANDVDPGDPAGTQYRVRILTKPPGLVFDVDEYGRFLATGADGVYTGNQRVYKTGVPQQDSTYTVTIGAAASVDADLPITYNMRALVAADLAINYNVAAAPGAPVNADMVFAYNVRNSVIADLVIAFDVRVRATADLIIGYNIIAEATQMSFTPSAIRVVSVGAGSKPFTAGELWNMSDPKKPRAPKDPDATIDFSFNWTPWLQDVADTIATHTILTTDGLTNEGSQVNGDLVTVFLSAGNPSKRGEVTCRISTNSSPPRIEDRTIYLDIESR